MRFVDNAKIVVRSGRGGDGCVSFRKEKYIAKGGPDGGDGGRGGCVFLCGDRNNLTLLDFRYKRLYIAKNGFPGEGRGKNGRSGKDIYLKLPLGTEIYQEIPYANKEILIADITKDKQIELICQGGEGGFGNRHFKSSTNQAPRHFEPGGDNEEKVIIFKYKLLADIGFIGLPNAGKSSMIRCFSNSKTKVGNFAFTTLKPHLGVLIDNNFFSRPIILADLPGLVKDATKDKGLGHRFLAHTERCSILAYVVDCAQDPIEAFDIVQKEINLHYIDSSVEFNNKHFIIILNKIDLITPKDLQKVICELKTKTKIKDIFCMSANTKEGVEDIHNNFCKIITKLESVRHSSEGVEKWQPMK